MSETDLVTTGTAPEAGAPDTPGGTAAPTRRKGLSTMVLAELRQLAGELNIADTAKMRKGDLIAAIKECQSGGPAPQLSLPTPAVTTANGDGRAESTVDEVPAPVRRRRVASRPAGSPRKGAATVDGGVPAATTDDAPAAPLEMPAAEAAPPAQPVPEVAAPEQPAGVPAAPSAVETDGDTTPRRSRQRRARGDRADRPDQGENGASVATPTIDVAPETTPEGAGEGGRRDGGRDNGRENNGSRENGARENVRNRGPRTDRTDDRGPRTDRNDRNDDRGGRPDERSQRDSRDDDGDDDGDGRGRRGRRFRDRRRGRDRDRPGQQGGQNTVDTEVRDDDVLLPVAGIVDILDNYAFVRTTGYLAGPTDVYVSLSMVRRYGLRRGDAVTGAVRQPREGEQSRQKFNPLVRVDTLNGQDPEVARSRPEFTTLTPLYPNERLRLETEPHKLTTRVIDLVMPVGKGQRALIVSPPKAGKTTIMQNIANAITTNNPECHLMVVLVDERPEEVTDMQRSVKGEVIASTFDRPPTDHTTVAELSIERAKRLVEMGHDVVVLLDNITRLGRAYNLAAPASGRILSGGVDSTALYPPKRFLGAARNIEGGGSLTIFATALVETGSTMDTVIFEEFKGTGNAELRLDRKIADKRVFPAIDVGDSGTRKEELLMSPDEYAVMVKLRRVLGGLDDQQAINLLLEQLRKTRTNIEFLMQVAKSTPGNDD
ncbi:MAG: transcription termination factor Rho [Pseudonocardia sp.]|nr:transcription termination factor Rho [Pseudonocardia sp.]